MRGVRGDRRGGRPACPGVPLQAAGELQALPIALSALKTNPRHLGKHFAKATGGPLAAGHFLPEECPDQILTAVSDHLTANLDPQLQPAIRSRHAHG